MVENFYSMLEKVGYGHPLHPMFTHIPMGMTIAMVVFSFLGLIWKYKNFDKTAFHCAVFALVSIPFVISAGVMDWQHFQQGEWSKYIIFKMILAGILTTLLILAVILKKKGVPPGKMMFVYLLCLACTGGLGYFGGSLAFG